MLLHAAFVGGFDQFRNNPHLGSDGWGEFDHRVGAFYARRGAQSAGELIAGYLNHEDPRPHSSLQHGFWNRTRAALMSVLTVNESDGSSRPALAPIAGAFGSGMISVACYRNHNSLEDGFRRTGISYSSYFATALFREFQPDIRGFANHLRHRKHDD